MEKNNKDQDQEQVTDVKGTIIGFVASEQGEQTQEEEIQNFKLKKKSEKELEKLSEEEQKKKRKEYEEEEERLEGVKAELLKSIRERIPAIENRFKTIVLTVKRGKVVEKVNGKTRQNLREKQQDLEQSQSKDEKERE